jgi:outer membrane protein assembly factor BamD (BamD/ComL family)
MTRQRLIVATLTSAPLWGCAHASSRPAPEVVASSEVGPSAADTAYAAALRELETARFQSAGQRFKLFAEKYPSDRRVPTARLQQAFAALDQMDQIRGLDEAQAILAQLPAAADPVALRELQALILARAQGLQAQAAVSQLLSQCEKTTDNQLDRQQSRAEVDKLQHALQKRERTLDEVKQRLLEIQQLATEMAGSPQGPPPEPPKPTP